MTTSVYKTCVLLQAGKQACNLKVPKPCRSLRYDGLSSRARFSTILPKASADTKQSAGKQNEERQPPWQFGFQTNERYLKWDDSAQRQLLKLHVAEKMGQDITWVEQKLQELVDIIPDLAETVDRVKANIIIELISDTQAVAQKVLDLRDLLPDLNISKLLAQYPYLIAQLDPGKVSQQLHVLRAELPGKDINDLLQREPLMLKANIKLALQELKRLNTGRDPADFLFRSPGLVLSMEEQMMESTIDGDLTQS